MHMQVQPLHMARTLNQLSSSVMRPCGQAKQQTVAAVGGNDALPSVACVRCMRQAGHVAPKHPSQAAAALLV